MASFPNTGNNTNASASTSSTSANTLERLCQRLSNNDPTLSVIRLDGSQLDRLLRLSLLAPQQRHYSDNDINTYQDEDRIAALAFAAAVIQNKSTRITRLELECGGSKTSSSIAKVEEQNGPSRHPGDDVLAQVLSRFSHVRLIGSGGDDERATILSRTNSAASLQSLATSPDAANGFLHRVPSPFSLLEDEEESNISAGAVILSHLARSAKLRRLSLSHLRVTRTLARALQQLLNLTSTLRDLELLSCSILDVVSSHSSANLVSLLVSTPSSPRTGSDRTAHTLTKALAWNTTLQTVTLDLGSGSLVLLAALEGLLQRFTVPTYVIHGSQNNNNLSPEDHPIKFLHGLFLKQSHRPLVPDAAQRLMDVLATVPIEEVRWQGGTHLQPFLEALTRNPTGCWTKLQLHDCDMTKDDVEALTLYLKLGSSDVDVDAWTSQNDHRLSGSTKDRPTPLATNACRLHELVLHEIPLGVSGFATLVHALQHNPSVRVLDVCDVQLHGTQAAKLLRNLLCTNPPSLQVLKLGEVGLDHPVQDSHLLAEGFSNNRTLQELDIFLCRNWDWVILAPSLVRIRTLRLPLCFNGIGSHPLSQVLSVLHTPRQHPIASIAAEAVAQPVQSPPQQRLAIIENEPPPPSVVNACANIAGLIELDLSHNRFGNAAAVVVSVFVRHSHHLQRLQLDQNHIGDEGASMLFRAIMRHPTLHQLSMAGNKLGEVAVRVLGEALPTAQLRHLSFWWKNKSIDKTLPFLMKGLAHNSSLLSLEVENGQGRIALPQIEFYLVRNMIQPWIQDEPPRQSQIPVALWPHALAWLSSKQTSAAAYYVLREKLPSWLMLYRKN